MFGEVGLTAGI